MTNNNLEYSNLKSMDHFYITIIHDFGILGADKK